MGDAAFAKKRAFAFVGAVDKLVNQHEGAGRQLFPEGTAGRQRNEIGDAGTLEHIDIGAVVDIGRRQAVALVVTGHEYHWKADDVANPQRRRRLPPGTYD